MLHNRQDSAGLQDPFQLYQDIINVIHIFQHVVADDNVIGVISNRRQEFCSLRDQRIVIAPDAQAHHFLVRLRGGDIVVLRIVIRREAETGAKVQDLQPFFVWEIQLVVNQVIEHPAPGLIHYIPVILNLIGHKYLLYNRYCFCAMILYQSIFSKSVSGKLQGTGRRETGP